MNAQDLRLKPALSIPDYELSERIGSGAYGEVWLGRNTATGARRAVKIVHLFTFENERPFLREFEGIKKFESISRSHPSQLSVFHVGQNLTAGYFYYVMELADAIQPGLANGANRTEAATDSDYTPHTLRSDLEAGRLPAEEVLKLGIGLAEATAHLHAHGLVHRDIKPSNIIFVGGRPKLADIGLVTDASDSRSIVGTEGYIAPEGPGTPQADLFALGKVLYEALTGLDRRNFPELPADIRRWPDRGLAFELNTIVVKACATSASERYANTGEMQEDLALLASGKSVRRRMAGKRRWRQTATVTVVASLIAAGFWSTRQTPKGEASQNQVGWSTNQEAIVALELGRAIASTDRHDPVSLANSRKYFEEAVRLDPNFAYAKATLASSGIAEIARGYRQPLEIYPEIDQLLKQALALEPGMAWAHWKRSVCLALFQHDWTGAEAEISQALKLEPKTDWRRSRYAYDILLPQCRFAEARREVLRALANDPADAEAMLVHAMTLYYMGENQEAMRVLDTVEKLMPDNRWALQTRAHVLMAQGRCDESLVHYRRLMRGSLASIWPQTFLFYAITLCGQREPGDPTLEDLLARASEPRAAFGMGLAYTALGDTTNALKWLNKACDLREWDMVTLRPDPRFKSLRKEPGFNALLRKMNLKAYSDE